ncbi:BrnT family toxin [Eggerthella lenta]|jgi:uncharacterized DUF497 family protein|uniref:BrnT family toxin n=1 Tax=Eggerthella lenta TaxID=84112 RepID=A0A369N3A9_EGGLN|nr:BrnT family toxin [Eggerthella lenta]KGI76228.1 hypothetical protein HMPREF9458_00120 [Eggerthella lenta 1_1_60AFAA]MCG4515911.1 BrnT family toxin [Eggerthella lenta]RDB84340.1 BrnT family toxin [Eggerthella lenta]RDC40685.1 BrnT family toxin [Eggerthella lenta]
MRFEYDPHKSSSNADKHGIDFEEAQELWDDKWRLAARVQRKGEERCLLIARHARSLWTAIYVHRDDAIRIISVRRSTDEEVSYYDRCRNDYAQRP